MDEKRKHFRTRGSQKLNTQRGREEVSREAHNLQTPVRFRAPQQGKKNTDFISVFFFAQCSGQKANSFAFVRNRSFGVYFYE
jgi:hypothetical protein